MQAGLILIAAAWVSAATHLFAHYRGIRPLVLAAKPATILLLISAAATGSGEPGYRVAIIAGLVFSLAGDIFLMMPPKLFLAGLGSFLCAHIAYIAAFSLDTPFGARPFLAIPYAAVALLIFVWLWPVLGRKRLPVALYIAAIVVMAWQATARAALHGSAGAIVAAAGAALFLISDGTLAVNRFRHPFKAAQAIVMTTYVAAQSMIAWSVL